MKIRINLQLIGAVFSLTAIAMTSVVYASCTIDQGSNKTQMTVEMCGSITPCQIWNDQVHLLASDNCWTWCCDDGTAHFDPNCVFHNETFIGLDRCCPMVNAGEIQSTKSCDPS